MKIKGAGILNVMNKLYKAGKNKVTIEADTKIPQFKAKAKVSNKLTREGD